MMRKVFFSFVLISAMSASVFAANFADDFEAASKLMKAGKYSEAQEAFVKLSELAPTAKSGDDALAYAVEAANHQKKVDEAFALAAKIKSVPASKNCRMGLMLNNSKFADLLNEFKDEDIGSWPGDIATEGFYRRGCAYAVTNNGVKAVADLEKAVEKESNPHCKINAALMLGTVYMSQLKDEQKAIAAFALAEKYHSENGRAAFMNSIVNLAVILTKQGKFDEALAKLSIIILSEDYWKAYVTATYGDVYLAKGDKAQATAKYKEALASEKAPKSLLDTIQKKLDGIK